MDHISHRLMQLKLFKIPAFKPKFRKMWRPLFWLVSLGRVTKSMHFMEYLRLYRYPDAAKSQIHRTKVALPTDISKVLASNPNLIQKAVECFYTRDPLQLRVSFPHSKRLSLKLCRLPKKWPAFHPAHPRLSLFE